LKLNYIFDFNENLIIDRFKDSLNENTTKCNVE